MVEVGLRLWHIASRGSVTFHLSTSSKYKMVVERVDWSGIVPVLYAHDLRGAN